MNFAPQASVNKIQATYCIWDIAKKSFLFSFLCSVDTHYTMPLSCWELNPEDTDLTMNKI